MLKFVLIAVYIALTVGRPTVQRKPFYKPVLSYRVMKYPDPAKHPDIKEEVMKKYVDDALEMAIE